MLVLDKQDTHLVRLNDFDLQPVVTNFAQDSQPTVFLHTLEGNHKLLVTKQYTLSTITK